MYLERKIGHEIFVKTEKTEYISKQLTFAHFDWKFIFPIKFRTFEKIFIFWISKMFQLSGKTTVNLLTNNSRLAVIHLYNMYMIWPVRPPYIYLDVR